MRGCNCVLRLLPKQIKLLQISHDPEIIIYLPEKRYEVRTEDNAVDVQIHRGALTIEPAAPIETSSQVLEANNSTNNIISPLPATAVDKPEEPLVEKARK